jgi:uncharacterized iron-regulated protein
MSWLVVTLSFTLGGCATVERTWHSLVGGQNPLVGKVWDVRAQKFISQSELVGNLIDADYVLLGEKHDNRDHHELQAEIIRGIARSGKKPRVVFEQIAFDQNAKLAAHLELKPKDSAGIAEVLEWNKSGWPDYKIYEPVFRAALESKLKILGVNMSSREVREVGARGLEALEDDLFRSLHLDREFNRGVIALMEEEIRASHCYMLPDSALPKFTTIQRARDATIAYRAEAAAKQDGAIFILGAGHARNEWGVPVYLRRINKISKIASVAFLEVKPEYTKPEIYIEGNAPFDYVWFTPANESTDACEKHKAELEGMRKKLEAASPSEPEVKSKPVTKNKTKAGKNKKNR